MSPSISPLPKTKPRSPFTAARLVALLAAFAGSTVASVAADEPAAYVAPEVKPEDILPGAIKTFTFSTSAIFPGTVREVTVFIPAQYTAAKPACVYVKTDGFNPKENHSPDTPTAH